MIRYDLGIDEKNNNITFNTLDELSNYPNNEDCNGKVVFLHKDGKRPTMLNGNNLNEALSLAISTDELKLLPYSKLHADSYVLTYSSYSVNKTIYILFLDEKWFVHKSLYDAFDDYGFYCDKETFARSYINIYIMEQFGAKLSKQIPLLGGHS